MDSKVYVPLLTTQAAPQKRALSRSPSASTGSLLIRAPPTLDSDSESIGDGTFSTSSSGGGGFNGYESDEAFRTGKEFEMASERPSVADPDEETFEESFNFELSGRLVADLDRKSLKSSIGDEEESIKVVSEYGQLVEPVLVSNPSLSRVMPKAQLSMDDDCEEGEEEEEEMMRGVGVDKGFSCKVRIPGIEVLEEIGGAFRIKALGVDEDELVEGMDSLIVKQSEPAMEVKVVEMAVSDEFVEAQSGVLLMGEEELVIEEPREDCVAAEVPEDMGLGAAEAAYIHSSTASGEHFMVRNQDVEENIKHSDEEKGVDKEGIELKGTNAGQGEIAELIETGSVATKSSTERDTVIDAEVTSEVEEETYITVNKTDVVSSNAEDFCDTSLLKGYVGVAQLEKQGAVTEGFAETVEINFVESSFTVREVNDSDGYVAKEAMVCQNSRSNGTDVSESFNLDKGAGNDNLEGKLELGINLGGRFHDSKAFTLVELLSNVPEGNDPDRIKAPVTENEDSPCAVDAQDFILGSSETAKRSTREFEQRQNSSFLFGVEGFQGHPQIVGGQVLIESDEEVNDDGERKKLFVPAELGALLKAATGANSEEAPTGLDSSFHSLRRASRLNCPNVSSLDVGARDDFEDNLNEEEKKKTEKIQLLRVKFLRLVQRLGISLEDSRVSKVLYRLDAGRHSSEPSRRELAAKTLAMQLEAEGKDDLDLSLNILVLGKSGVGKSATINSLFSEKKVMTGAFEPTTTTVKEIVGAIDGVKIRFLDTPGFRSSAKDQSINWKILASIKKFLRKFPPDVVLYVDRLDTTQLGDLTDLPLLKSITSSLGTSIWLNAVVTLTHAASALPDGQFGLPLGYAKFVSQQSAAIRQSINQAIGDLSLMNQSNMPPVALVENHPLCQKDSSGERVLPNGLIWRAHLLFVFYSIRILSEATPLLIPQNPVDLQKLSGFRFYFPPPTYFLASLLQPYSHPKLSGDRGGDDMDSDIELGNLSASVEEDDDEYNQLPPFIPLRKSQIAELKKEQRKAYFEEYDYRVQLLQKKQWKQLKGLREMKKKGKDGCNNYVSIQESEDQDDRSPMDVPDPLVNVPATSPDMALPVSFDADDPAYRYRLLEPSSHLVARPVPIADVWDHSLGYDAVELERSLVIASRFPADFGVRIKKDKKEFSVCLDSSVAAKHGKNASTMGRFKIQTVGEQLAFILRGETRVTNLSINKTTAGVTVTFLNGNVATGLKIEDQIAVGKLLVLAGSAGVVSSQDETASGANLELRFIDDDFPANFGMSLVKAARDVSIMAHLQSQFSIGRNTKMAIHIGVNDKRSGQIAIRTSSSEQLKITLFSILPIACSIFRSTCHRFGVKNSDDD